MSEQYAAFYHAIRKEVLCGTILGREMVNKVNMYKLSYIEGKSKLVAFVSPKNVIPFEA